MTFWFYSNFYSNFLNIFYSPVIEKVALKFRTNMCSAEKIRKSFTMPDGLNCRENSRGKRAIASTEE
jgi:hypothetical protein